MYGAHPLAARLHRYLYIAIIYNTCYTIALYYLLIFYVGCEELLEVGGSIRVHALVPTCRRSGCCGARVCSCWGHGTLCATLAGI